MMKRFLLPVCTALLCSIALLLGTGTASAAKQVPLIDGMAPIGLSNMITFVLSPEKREAQLADIRCIKLPDSEGYALYAAHSHDDVQMLFQTKGNDIYAASAVFKILDDRAVKAAQQLVSSVCIIAGMTEKDVSALSENEDDGQHFSLGSVFCKTTQRRIQMTMELVSGSNARINVTAYDE